MRGVGILAASLFIAALIFGLAPASTGQSQMSILVCRDIQVISYGQNNTRGNPLGCARQFSTSLPYLVLFVELTDVDQSFALTWELIEPSGEVYVRQRYRQEVGGGSSWTIFFWHVLPISASGAEIIEKDSRFRGRVVEVGAVPISQKTGQWTLRVTATPGPSALYKFTLVP